MDGEPITYQISPPISDQALNALFSESWPNHTSQSFQAVLFRSLAYVCAFAGEELIGFVNLAWDGGIHAFLLDTTVHPRWQRRGIGRELVQRAAQAARQHNMHWLHVDYEPHLQGFYQGCGFAPTLAGLMRLE